MNTGTLILSTNVAGASVSSAGTRSGPQRGDLAVHVGTLEPEVLVGLAGRVAVGDPLPAPSPTPTVARRLDGPRPRAPRTRCSGSRPGTRRRTCRRATDSGVIAARCGGRVAATQSWREGGVRDPDHADLAVRDPRLRGDGLDHVVAVERLERLEVVERAARAPGAAEVHADGRVSEDLRDARRRLAPDRGSTGRSPSTRRRSGTGRPRAVRAATRWPTAACRRAS